MNKRQYNIVTVPTDIGVLRSTIEEISTKYGGSIISVTWTPSRGNVNENNELDVQPGYVIVAEFG